MMSVSAGTGKNSQKFLKEALQCSNAKLLNILALERDRTSGEMRTSELTPLMIACIMGKLSMVKLIIKAARK